MPTPWHRLHSAVVAAVVLCVGTAGATEHGAGSIEAYWECMERNDLASHSLGQDPERRVRIYKAE